MRRRSLAAALLFVLSACGRTGSKASDEGSGNTAGSSNVAPTGGGAGGRVMDPETRDCEHPHPGAAPLSMLTNDELRLSLQELLGKAEQTERLPPEDDSGSVSELLVSVMHDIAHATAQTIVSDPTRLAAVVDCDPAAGAEACSAHFIERFLRQAFRRPATSEERTEMGDVFQRGQELGRNFDSGVRAVIEVTLQSPEFLYLLEFGSGPANNGVVALAPFEMAARLSFFLTGGPPDADLSEAAEQGRLQQGSGLEEQVRRLVGSPANRDHVVSFYRHIYRLQNDGSAEVPVSNELLEFAREETRLFIEDATFEIGTYRALLTEPTTWLNEPLARFYGYSDVTGAEFRKVELDPAKRAGLFTQQAFLDATSFTRRPGTMQRGLVVLNQLLCVNMPPDPPSLDPIEPPDPLPDGTWRKQLEAFTSPAECAGCHAILNAAGFAFEHYDAVGRYRTLDAGQPIDASGTLSVTDAAGTFEDATQLLQHIANSKDGQACFVRHWLEHAYRRQLDTEDSCVMAELTRSFEESDGSVVQLMLALARSDRFKYRLNSELAP
jgi:hypothetical protein